MRSYQPRRAPVIDRAGGPFDDAERTPRMRCVACEKDTKPLGKGTPPTWCGHCGHAFALNRQFDGVADIFVKRAVDAVTANGEHRYLPEQLSYEIERRLATPSPLRRAVGWIVLAVAVVAAFEFVHFWVAIFVAVFGIKFLPRLVKKLPGPKVPRKDTAKVDVAQILKRYGQVNPSPHRISPDETAEHETSTALDGVIHDRLLVCERADFAAFYLANEFHLQNACHVMSGAGDTVARKALVSALREPAAPEIFVVHDLTPRGLGFAESIDHGRDWFAGHAGAKVVDLGLSGGQARALRTWARPLTAAERVPGAPAIPDLAPDTGLDLAFYRPKQLLEITRRAMDGRTSFTELAADVGSDFRFDVGGGDGG